MLRDLAERDLDKNLFLVLSETILQSMVYYIDSTQVVKIISVLAKDIKYYRSDRGKELYRDCVDDALINAFINAVCENLKSELAKFGKKTIDIFS
jgi:hypothetical protein